MAWIEAHQELPRHPKTKRLARMLKISIAEAVGHLFLFWWWTLDYADDGDLSDYDAYDIADAAQWSGDAEEFLTAMINCGSGDACGFIERNEDGMYVHNWATYSGRLVEKRARNRQRQARLRKHNGDVTRDVCVTCDDVTRESQGYTTEHNTTQQDTTQHNIPPSPPKRPADAAETERPEAEAETVLTLSVIVSLWNDKLASQGFPRVLRNTPSREKAFKERLNISPTRKTLTWWVNLFERISLSDFMRKSVQEQNWLTLDWLLNENNLVKVLEGKYDNKAAVVEDRPVRTFADILAKHEREREAVDVEYTLPEEGEHYDRDRSPGFLRDT